MHYILVAFLLSIHLSRTNAAKILGIFIANSRSHHSMNQPIVKGLAARGHEVTIISHFKSSSPIQNYTEIQLGDGLQSFIDSLSIEDSQRFTGLKNYIRSIQVIERQSCAKVLGLKYIQDLITSPKKHIDLLIAEAYHKRCYLLLAHKLNVPLILISPPSVVIGIDHFLGNPNNPSHNPLLINAFTTKMSFFQRLENSLQYVILYWYHHFIFNDDVEQIAIEYLHMKEIPSDDILNQRAALAFYNNHFSFIPRARSPNVIDIAGIHIQEAKKLPQDIEEFIEGSSDGVILFSFGSTIKASTISQEKLHIIKEVFSSIPQRVLWRIDELNINDVPSNVKLGKWFPQRDILEHKNVIAFISHCGLFGTLEAIYTATPVIGIPFMFDQYQDAKLLAEKGAGIYIDYHTMDKNTLLEAINTIILQKSYHQNMQKLSDIFRDRPISQQEEAMYWSEYILKFKGAPHLRTQGADMSLYQYLLLDVGAFLLIVTISILYICKYFLKIVVRNVFQKKIEKNKTS